LAKSGARRSSSCGANSEKPARVDWHDNAGVSLLPHFSRSSSTPYIASTAAHNGLVPHGASPMKLRGAMPTGAFHKGRSFISHRRLQPQSRLSLRTRFQSYACRAWFVKGEPTN
jgi:hypothetical protein